MSDVVIKAEGLGKKYLIGHQSERERYTALRDVLTRNVKGLWNKTRQVLSGQQLLAGDEIEEFWALRDIDFEIKRGDRVGIIGRNGAGKSTLLKVLSRITEPSTGRIEIKGRVASLLEVGTGFHPELTGRENIYLNGAILGMARAEIKKKFDEIVDFAGVDRFLDTPVKRYSSGMYVRLAFAVAAHLEPEILIVDEVLAVGDFEFQKKCLGKMEDVSKNEGRTVLFVSHNMGIVKALCTHGILLKNGKAIYEGSMGDTIKHYIANQTKSDVKGLIIPAMRKYNTGEVFIRQVRLVKENGDQTEDLYYREGIRLIFDVEVVSQINNMLFDVKIISEADIVVAHHMNTFSEKAHQTLNKGRWIIEVLLDNALAPGSYSVTGGVHHPNGVTIEYVEDVYPFNVLRAAEDDEKNYNYEWVHGYHHPVGTWKFSMNESVA
jgi:lipopolysaccharide transport system ATP-binding protein